MSRGTSIQEMYTTIGAIILSSTGRPWWKRGGKQVKSNQPYATIWLSPSRPLMHQVVETMNDSSMYQVPWMQGIIECQVEFFGSRDNDTHMDAAERLRTSFYLADREWDLHEIAGISGAIEIVDISGMFREDIEPRSQVRFNLFCNLSTVRALEGHEISDIDNVDVTVTVNDVSETTTIDRGE